jgi:hypothetical protein
MMTGTLVWVVATVKLMTEWTSLPGEEMILSLTASSQI